MNSIRLRLLKWLIGPILLFNLAVGALTYLLAWMPNHNALDRGLSDPASALIALEVLFTLILVGLIWFSVSNGLRPLNWMRASLRQREGDDLAMSFQPLPNADVPYELEPVVNAFNELLGKVQAGARNQQDFLANVAHQLRTPLAGLALQIEWLAARHANDTETAASLKLMHASTERLIRQSNQLLALARAEPSHFEKTRLEPLDLAALIQDSVQVFVDAASKKNIDIGFELEPGMVLGEHFLLRDLVDNLVDNAIRYTPPDGVVTVRCRSTPEGTELVIEDSGPGIEPAKRSMVFNRHVRLDDKSSGSGLGLAIVRDIALAHGARIQLGDHPGSSGVVFSVRFPPA